jgi:CO dehydrogenase/acetyl-CoA synthase beta subunit
MNQIVKDFGKGFKQLGVETAEKLVQETGKIAESVITAKELLGDIKPMSDEEMAQKRAEEDRKKEKEISDVRSHISGRNVESEMQQISQQKEKEEEEKEKYFEKMKEQQERERQQQMESSELTMESSNPSKQKKSRGSAFGHKKKSQPDQSQMSQTAEYKGKID